MHFYRLLPIIHPSFPLFLLRLPAVAGAYTHLCISASMILKNLTKKIVIGVPETPIFLLDYQGICCIQMHLHCSLYKLIYYYNNNIK